MVVSNHRFPLAWVCAALALPVSCEMKPAPKVEGVAAGESAAPADRLSSVHALFDLSSVSGAPFPSDLFTVADASNRTGRRVKMPRPDCSHLPPGPSDCDDIDVINQLDGFNIMPRISIPFDGAIDPASVSSNSVFIVELAQQGDETTIEWNQPGCLGSIHPHLVRRIG